MTTEVGNKFLSLSMQALAVQLQLATHEFSCIHNYHSSYMYSIPNSGAGCAQTQEPLH